MVDRANGLVLWHKNAFHHRRVFVRSADGDGVLLGQSEMSFQACGQGERVIDPRELDTEEVLQGLQRSFIERDQARRSLAMFLPDLRRQAEEQMTAIADRIKNLVEHRRGKSVG